MTPHNAPGEFREFGLTSLAIRHPTVVLVMTAIIILTGLSAYITIPKESSPEIVVPMVVVNTIYTGVAPRDIETLLTRPLEEELNTIADVKRITSTSVEGYSSIIVEFDAGMDMDEALQRVREKVDIAKPRLPTAAEEPGIFEINFAQFPIMQVNIAGPYSLVRLREVAEDLQDRIEQIPSVLEVTLSGGLEREVQVDVDLAKLQFYNLAYGDVIDAIRDENVTIPGGSVDVGDMKFLVRVPGQFEATALIADIVVKVAGGRAIYVRDVATVDFGFKERDSYARLDGQSVVSLAISKRAGENIIATAEAVRDVLASREAHFPVGTVVKVTADQSEDIHDMVSSLENNIISGLILVVAVLLFFLGMRTASFVGLAIPMSMLLSFSVMQLTGMTMNMVVLFALILALGMLVDNAIVVVENIYRFVEQGFDRKTAARYAVGEVAVPIIASTLTTLAAFFPLTFWPGIVGEFMKFLPLTLIITLSASLFVALVIVPVLCSLLLELEGARTPPMTPAARWTLIGGGGVAMLIVGSGAWLAPPLLILTGILIWQFHTRVAAPIGAWFMTAALPRIISRYEHLLRWALEHRLRMLAAAAGAMVLAIMAFSVLNAGIEFFPEDIPPATVYVQVEAPAGTRLEATDAMVQGLEAELRALSGSEDFQSVVATSGNRVSQNFGGPSNGSHLATIAVNFVDFQDRRTDGFVTLERMRQTIGRTVAGAHISVEAMQGGPPSGAPVAIEIAGEDPEVLRDLGAEVVRILENSPAYPKLDGLASDMEGGRPELVINVDRERAALWGLNTQDVGFMVRSAINGTEASKYRDGKDEYDITVRLAPAWRSDLSALGDLMLATDDGAQVPLSSVASWHVGTGMGDVRRKDLDRVVSITSDVRAGYNANAVVAEVRELLAPFERELPAGYTFAFGGQQEEQAEAQAFLSAAFVMAVLLIGFILVSQFDSVTKPLIILSSVVLSTIGVLIGLIVFRMPFGIIMTGVGVISLAGVVVNNAIVLLDYTDILRDRDGLTRREAVVTAGRTRFRPVVLTAITTVLGLVPLAIGLNFDFLGLYTRLAPEFYWGGEQAAWWGPMAIAVIAGLTFATFLTLVIVPVMYSLLDDLDKVIKRYFLPQETSEAAVPHAPVRPSRETEAITV
ncbi:MAG: efflux RND transporter permease subunit [Gemmatimonadales bacterium]